MSTSTNTADHEKSVTINITSKPMATAKYSSTQAHRRRGVIDQDRLTLRTMPFFPLVTTPEATPSLRMGAIRALLCFQACIEAGQTTPSTDPPLAMTCWRHYSVPTSGWTERRRVDISAHPHESCWVSVKLPVEVRESRTQSRFFVCLWGRDYPVRGLVWNKGTRGEPFRLFL